jgi:hypothetical protein
MPRRYVCARPRARIERLARACVYASSLSVVFTLTSFGEAAHPGAVDADAPSAPVGFPQGVWTALELVRATPGRYRGLVLIGAEAEPDPASLRAGPLRETIAGAPKSPSDTHGARGHDDRMLPVTVTIFVQGKDVLASHVRDKSVAAALTQMGRDIGRKLDKVRCPTHGKGPTDVRVHVGKDGNADLRYESCCAKLKDAVGRALG